jgi:hypothetical protein
VDQERWQRVRVLFHLALEHEPEERPALLDHACRGDTDLRNQVELLLARVPPWRSGIFVLIPASTRVCLLRAGSSRVMQSTRRSCACPGGGRYEVPNSFVDIGYSGVGCGGGTHVSTPTARRLLGSSAAVHRHFRVPRRAGRDAKAKHDHASARNYGFL